MSAAATDARWMRAHNRPERHCRRRHACSGHATAGAHYAGASTASVGVAAALRGGLSGGCSPRACGTAIVWSALRPIAPQTSNMYTQIYIYMYKSIYRCVCVRGRLCVCLHAFMRVCRGERACAYVYVCGENGKSPAAAKVRVHARAAPSAADGTGRKEFRAAPSDQARTERQHEPSARCARSLWCACGGAPSPGADVGTEGSSPGADVGRR